MRFPCRPATSPFAPGDSHERSQEKMRSAFLAELLRCFRGRWRPGCEAPERAAYTTKAWKLIYCLRKNARDNAEAGHPCDGLKVKTEAQLAAIQGHFNWTPPVEPVGPVIQLTPLGPLLSRTWRLRLVENGEVLREAEFPQGTTMVEITATIFEWTPETDEEDPS